MKGFKSHNFQGRILPYQSVVQWSPDLRNRMGPSQLFVKPGYSLNPKFLLSKKIFEVKSDSLNLDDSLNPASTVLGIAL